MDLLSLEPLLKAALQEDLGHGDLTTEAISKGSAGNSSGVSFLARVEAREELVLAGWPVFRRVFQLLGKVQDEVNFSEGSEVGTVTIGVLRAENSVLLRGERVALNFLQRLCGVATTTRKYVDLVAHTPVKLLDTRKTTPLWRSLEKYAVRMGGGYNHRQGLDDGILIKENHLAVAGGIEAAVQACRNRESRNRKDRLQRIEVEVRTVRELEEAIGAGADSVLLDNMAVDDVQRAVQITKGRCLLEASGGINENNVVQYAQTGVDFISLGILTHSYRASDISMLLEPEK